VGGDLDLNGYGDLERTDAGAGDDVQRYGSSVAGAIAQRYRFARDARSGREHAERLLAGAT
jgi:hypothetical protein